MKNEFDRLKLHIICRALPEPRENVGGVSDTGRTGNRHNFKYNVCYDCVSHQKQ